MRVIFDWNCFQRGGIHRYFAEIIPRVAKTPGLEVRILGNASRVVAPPRGEGIEELSRLTPSATWMPDGRIKRTLSRARQAVEKALWRWRATPADASPVLYHPTHYQPSPVGSARQVITIHDLIPELFPELTRGGVFDDLRRDKKRAIAEAALIFANSENTKRDLCAFYGTPADRVHVTPLGVDYDFFSTPVHAAEWERTRETLGLREEPFFLYVGARGHYKNFAGLVEAFDRGGFAKEACLVAAGPAWTDGERTLLRDRGLADHVRLVEMPDESVLRALYQKAFAFVYPSRYEGFGLPVLEAMSAGAPVVAARAGAIPEVGKDAILYFDPNETDSLVHALRLVAEPTLRATLATSGVLRARELHWDRTSELTVAGYRKVLES